MTASDAIFDILPKNIRDLIDEAFDNAVNPNNTSTPLGAVEKPARKIPENGGGGFIIEDDQDYGANEGGFIVEEPQTSNSPQHIPFDLIPHALQLLDLPPDDEEILAVLRNAASGWTSASIAPSRPLDPEARYVSREDWRSVCAVLLDNRVSDIGDEDKLDDSSQYARDEEDEDVSMNTDYDETGSVSEGDSDDEYQDEYYSSSRKRGKAPRRKQHLSPSLPTDPQKPSSRQKQTCLDAFALFFPEVAHEDLLSQKIKISDLQRVSTLLGEKTKADELVEMLDMFSTSRDKTMNFDDFTRMMITAKLA